MTTIYWILGGVIIFLIGYIITSKNDDDQNKGNDNSSPRGPEDLTVWRNGFPYDGNTIH